VLGTQIVATLIAVYGVFMTPLGWRWAGFVWVYALAWFCSMTASSYSPIGIFDPVKAPSSAKNPVDLTPQIATRAYELYQQRGGGDGKAESRLA